jgi:hypothetical protein
VSREYSFSSTIINKFKGKFSISFQPNTKATFLLKKEIDKTKHTHMFVGNTITKLCLIRDKMNSNTKCEILPFQKKLIIIKVKSNTL